MVAQEKFQESWNQWSKYVLKELERLNESCESMSEQIQKVREDIVALKVKAGIWGLVGGIIPVALALLVYLVERLIAK